ncbi:flagellar export chaperone FliS [Oceanisphaera sp. DM8]|uniref:Flagellar secretion chaperone FliS n=2 Tax=Oceanisphaera pacifica TaxID=2818389 RepID=A0ABS3NKI6_9GAMM|nr:flagellar export chaperone FliS [Oceanisphaera pacifica]
MRGSMKAYKSVALDSQKSVASPYRIVQMLLAGALERLAKTRTAIEQQNYEQRGELVSSTMMIIDELRLSLDYEDGGEIAQNLGRLYDFMMNELVSVNMNNDLEKLESTSRLLREIKESWDAIPVAQQEVPA